MRLEVFDPAMCCSTGVCGPNPDPALAPFAADLDWVAAQGVAVRRYNLGQEAGAFVEHEAVRVLLQEQGEAALPVVMADGTVRSTGRYPARAELAVWAGLTASPTISSALVTELAAIGAAVGANCEPCLKYHYDEARKLGLTRRELEVALRAAQTVKDVPTGSMVVLASKLLGGATGSPVVAIADIADVQPAEAAGGGSDAAAACCGGPASVEQVADPAPSKGCC